MEAMNDSAFDDAVVRFFGPLAVRANSSLQKLRDGIYQIAGTAFVVRIRRGTGHRKDFVVTLSPKKSGAEDLDDLSGEIGLGVFAEYHGRPLQMHELDSKKDWLLAFEEAARAAEVFCLPYLVGEQTDLQDVRHFIEQKVEESGIRTKKYHFPPKVREEWL
jgi:hypothetical protein